MKLKHSIRAIVFGFLCLAMLVVLSNLFQYSDRSIWSTNARVENFQDLPQQSVDVLFLGTSNVMSSINPLQIWQETGLQTYNYCGRAQSFPFTYAYLTDALKTQSPECIVIDAWSVFSDHITYELADSEFHFRLNMESLSWGSAKLQLIQDYVPWKDRLSMCLPIFKNHNDYKTWTLETDETDRIFMGYCYVDKTDPYDVPQYSSASTPIPEPDRVAVDQILALCQQENIIPIFIKTPAVLTDEQHAKINGLGDYLAGKNVLFYNLCAEEPYDFSFQTGLSDNTHVNTVGAQEVTRFITEVLLEQVGDKERPTHQYAYVWANEYQRMLEVFAPKG